MRQFIFFFFKSGLVSFLRLIFENHLNNTVWLRAFAYVQILSFVHAELVSKLLIPAARVTFLGLQS